MYKNKICQSPNRKERPR